MNSSGYRISPPPPLPLPLPIPLIPLPQDGNVPLEDELEALCRLHAARAELILSGDAQCFAGVAPLVEAHPFLDKDQVESVVTGGGSGNSSSASTVKQSISASGNATIQRGISGGGSGSISSSSDNQERTAGQSVSKAQSGGGSVEGGGVAVDNGGLAGGVGVTTEVSSAVGSATNASGGKCVEQSVERTVELSVGEKAVAGNVHVRRLAALENCLSAFERCCFMLKLGLHFFECFSRSPIEGSACCSSVDNLPPSILEGSGRQSVWVL